MIHDGLQVRFQLLGFLVDFEVIVLMIRNINLATFGFLYS